MQNASRFKFSQLPIMKKIKKKTSTLKIPLKFSYWVLKFSNNCFGNYHLSRFEYPKKVQKYSHQSPPNSFLS